MKFSNQKKSLGVNLIHGIIKFELLMQTQVKKNSYLILILLDSRGSLQNGCTKQYACNSQGAEFGFGILLQNYIQLNTFLLFQKRFVRIVTILDQLANKKSLFKRPKTILIFSLANSTTQTVCICFIIFIRLLHS